MEEDDLICWLRGLYDQQYCEAPRAAIRAQIRQREIELARRTRASSPSTQETKP